MKSAQNWIAESPFWHQNWVDVASSQFTLRPVHITQVNWTEVTSLQHLLAVFRTTALFISPRLKSELNWTGSFAAGWKPTSFTNLSHLFWPQDWLHRFYDWTVCSEHLGVFMAALRSRCGHYIFALWFLLSILLFFFFLSSFILPWSQPSQIACIPYFHSWCGLSTNLRCRSETCCTRLTENTGCKKSPKIRHLGTIAQLCRAISLQLRHISTIGNKTC